MPVPQPLALDNAAVDSHVHLHDIADLQGLLDSALQAFKQSVKGHGAGWPFVGIMILTEPQSCSTFSLLQQRLRQESAAPTTPWKLFATAENISLRATHDQGDTLLLLSGQQIVTRENIEVLSLLAPPDVPDGLSLAETVQKVLTIGGLPVLPWGVGKWLGKRGAIVSKFLAETVAQPLFLGDNGSRPAFWRSIPQFEQAQKAGIPTLRGSDPLRCSYRRRGPGSFGNLLTCHIDMQHPGKSLREALTDRHFPPIEFGELEKPWHFLKDQITLRIS